MTKSEFEKQYCSNCKHKLEKLFDKCTPFVSKGDQRYYIDCSFFVPINKEDKNGS